MTPPTVGNAKKLLLIDDDQDFTLAMGILLGHAGYTVRRARDGQEGLRMAAEDPPDAVLLDYFMPVKNGFVVAEELRRMPGLDRVPIIVLTAFGRNVGEIHGLPHDKACAHIQDFLEKPVEPNVLLDRLARLLADA
jgi:DNA-binding response OmpR family regulator